jgi:hypothetical protein
LTVLGAESAERTAREMVLGLDTVISLTALRRTTLKAAARAF